MAKRSKKSGKASSQLQGYVVVTFADNYDQAKEFESLLKCSEIPVVVEEHFDGTLGANEIAVMVPDEYLDEAHVIIESQDTYDEFYDLTDEDEDFGDDYFDDEY